MGNSAYMNNNFIPMIIEKIQDEALAIGFKLSCDSKTGTLLKSLASSKNKGKFLELGTGVGVSTAWILEGMDANSELMTVELEESLQKISRKYLDFDKRVDFILGDGGEIIKKLGDHQKFDFIFADTYPGKYYQLDETLGLLNIGAFYIIDDLLPVDENDNDPKMEKLVRYLETREDLSIIKLNWSTGIIIATKIS